MEMKEDQVDAKRIPVVERKIGAKTRLWDRNAVFVANLLSLFFGNTRGAEVLRHEVGSLETYGGRLIPILNLAFQGGGNLLVLEGKPDPVLCDYFEKDLGFSLPDVVVGRHSDYLSVLENEGNWSEKAMGLVERVRNHPAEFLDGFVTDRALVRLAAVSGKRLVASREGSHRGNNKYLLHQFLKSRGLPVFDTVIARDEAGVAGAIEGLGELGYRHGVVKAQVGASGIGMLRLDFAKPERVPEYLFHEGPCLIQGWLEEGEGIRFLGSPSVQMFVGDDRICLFDLTEQILSRRSIHEGNVAPPTYLEENVGLREELLSQGEVAARWLHREGYRGTASGDFHVIERRGRREVRLCEVNARITGATYPSLLARFFRSGGAWLMRNVRLARPYPSRLILDALDEACLLFQLGLASGIVPINFNLTRDGYVGKGQFLAIGSDVAEVMELFRAVRNLEVILGEYDRD
jgi:hypothetical protein